MSHPITLPREIATLPDFAPEIVFKHLGGVTPHLPVVVPFFVCSFMDVLPQRVHQVKFNLRHFELTGVLDVKVSSQLPSFGGKLLTSSDLGEHPVFRDVSKPFSGSGTTLQFPWRVTGWNLVQALWAWLTKGAVTAKCWGTLSEFIFQKEFHVDAKVPVR